MTEAGTGLRGSPAGATPGRGDAETGGMLLLDKHPGISSFQALRPWKRRYPGRKIGHAGTLDPAASGLLLVGVGAGTRLLEFLEGLPKTYTFLARLGLTSDTYDMEGKVAPAGDAGGVDAARLELALAGFRGPILQRPPAFSAVKVDGERAYALARAGETVELAPRAVQVHALELRGFQDGVASLEAVCSKGTYVRALAHDLGQVLGCGAVADRIRRTAIGPFRVEEAVPAGADGAALLPLENAVAHLPAAVVQEAGIAAFLQGRPAPAFLYSWRASAAAPGEACRALDPAGRLLAIAAPSPEGLLCPRKVLVRE